MKSNLVRQNLVLTKKLKQEFEREAIKKCGGNMSLLIKLILANRYDMPQEIEKSFRYMLETI